MQQWLETSAQYAAAASVVAGAAWATTRAFWVKVVLPAKRLAARGRKLAQDVLDVKASTARLEAELRPNGGSSLRDAVDGLATRMDLFSARKMAALDAQDVAYFETDSGGRLTIASRSLCRLAGRDDGELMGNGWLDSIMPVDRPRVAEAWHDSVARGTALTEYAACVRPSGSAIACRIDACPVVVAGSVAGWVGLVTKVEEVGHVANG